MANYRRSVRSWRNLSLDMEHANGPAHLPRFLETLASLYAALLFFAVAVAPLVPEEVMWGFGAMLLIGVLGVSMVAGLRILRDFPLMIWSPLPWFLFSSAAYFGFGPLVYFSGVEEAVIRMDASFPVNPNDLLKATQLNLAFLATTVFAFRVGTGPLPAFQIPPPIAFTTQHLWRAASAALVIGLPVFILASLPHALGRLDFTLPGSLGRLEDFLLIAIVPLYYLARRRAPYSRLLLGGLVGALLGVGFLTFAKTAVLKVVLVIGLAAFSVAPSFRRLLQVGALAAFLFVLLQPLVHFGRAAIGWGATDGNTASLTERAGFMREGFSAEAAYSQQRLGWWTRLNYAAEQTFAVVAYDEGRPGDSLVTALYAPIPRYLWPEKPIITGQSREWNFLVRGIRTSSASPGIAAEAYWNGGWLALVGIGSFYGLLMARLGMFSMKKILDGDLSYLIVGFGGIWLGARSDGWFAADVVGGGGITVALALLIWAIRTGFLQRRRRWRQRPRTPRGQPAG